MGNDNGTGMVNSFPYGETPADGTGIVSSSLNEEIPADAPGMDLMQNGSVRDGMPPDGTPVMDSEHALEMLLMFQENGIDTTEAEAALEDGDMDAVMAFLEENRPADGDP
jgi:hypothetical protein